MNNDNNKIIRRSNSFNIRVNYDKQAYNNNKKVIEEDRGISYFIKGN